MRNGRHVELNRRCLRFEGLNEGCGKDSLQRLHYGTVTMGDALNSCFFTAALSIIDLPLPNCDVSNNGTSAAVL